MGMMISNGFLYFNSSCPRNLRHFGNPKNENLLRSPKFYGENEFTVEMCISQLITEILSFFCFHKNFMTNLSFQIDSTEPGTTFLKICLDSAYSIDSKKGLTFENLK